MTRPSGRAGSLLALALLVLLALQLLAHGALLMARSERASSGAGLHLLQARASADAGAAAAWAGATAAWDSIPLWGSGPPVAGSLGEHPFQGWLRRVSREYWIAEGQGRSVGENWGVTVRYLVWLLDPLGRIDAAQGAAEGGGVLSGTDAVAFDGERPGFCDRWSAALDSLVSPEVWGRVHQASPTAVGEPSLGRLGAGDLAGLLPELGATSGTPGPVLRRGGCDGGAPWNWGDPLNAGGPCGDRLVAWSVPGDLHLGPGVGQGILAVHGSLDLSGTRFDGVVLVGRDLVLRDGAQVRGMVRVGSDLDVVGESRIHGSPCRALRAMESFRSLLRVPMPVAEAGVLEGGG